MAFSKAKLTRFNDVISTTPAPGTYHPKKDNRVVGAVISSSGRFVDRKSPTGSVHSENSSKSITSSPCFRTPVLPRRRQLLRSYSAQKPTSDFRLNQNNEELREKIVECMNKTQSIKDLELQIDELKERIQVLELDNDRLQVDAVIDTKKFEDRIEFIETEHNIRMEELQDNHEKNLHEFERSLKNMNLEADLLKEWKKVQHEEVKNMQAEFCNEYAQLREMIEMIHEENASLEQINLATKTCYTNELELIIKERDTLLNESEIIKLELKARILKSEEYNSDLEKNNENLNIVNIQLQQQIQSIEKTETKLLQKIEESYNYNTQLEEKIQSKQQLILKLQNELSNAQCDLAEKGEFESKLSNRIEELNDLVFQHNQNTLELETKVNDLTELLREKESELRLASEIQSKLEGSHTELLDKLKTEHQTEIKDLEFEMLKLVTEGRQKHEKSEKEHAKFVNDIRVAFDTQLQKTLEETTEKMQLLESDMNKKCSELEEFGERKIKEQELQSEAILKECQAISEYNIILCEFEKKEIQMKLSDTERDLNNALSSKEKSETTLLKKNAIIQELQRKLSSIIIELNNVRENFDSEKRSLTIELEACHIQKRRYVITLSETRLTVEVLQKRLVESDKDVEQLKTEMEILEADKLKTENLLIELKERIAALQEYNSNIDRQYYENLETLRQEIFDKEAQLTNDVNDLKKENYRTIEDLEQHNKRLSKERDEQIKLIEDNASMLEQMKKRLVIENEKLQQSDKQNKEILEQLKQHQKMHADALSLVGNARIEIERLELEQTELVFKNKRLETQLAAKSSPQVKLTRNVENITKPTKGDLNLMAENQELNAKLRKQSKLIEKLRNELSTDSKSTKKSKFLSTNKENQSPIKTGIVNQHSGSPSTTPLKDKNIRQ